MFVVSDIFVALNSLPGDVKGVAWGLEDPAVIKTEGWARMTAENEHFALWLRLGATGYSRVLCTGPGDVAVSAHVFLFPNSVLWR